MLEMPSIESDFPVLGGVDFNLLFCYESPSQIPLACFHTHGIMSPPSLGDGDIYVKRI
jgi:hypothetical protein